MKINFRPYLYKEITLFQNINKYCRRIQKQKWKICIKALTTKNICGLNILMLIYQCSHYEETSLEVLEESL